MGTFLTKQILRNWKKCGWNFDPETNKSDWHISKNCCALAGKVWDFTAAKDSYSIWNHLVVFNVSNKLVKKGTGIIIWLKYTFHENNDCKLRLTHFVTHGTRVYHTNQQSLRPFSPIRPHSSAKSIVFDILLNRLTCVYGNLTHLLQSRLQTHRNVGGH
jgi:hypothetical protein